MNNINPEQDKLVTSADWDSKWTGIFEHYQHDLRHAYYIDAVRRKDESRILEIAAGSFRDIARLNKNHIEGYGMDFSQEAVTLAQKYYPALAPRFSQRDAFNLGFEDNYFDLTYHNGFWVLFQDEEIKKLAIEQARVSRQRMIVTVHNGHNKNFKHYFESKRATDNLFDIRFFEVDEITALMKTVCSKVTVVPVGKGKKRYEDFLIRKGLGHPAILKTWFNIAGHRHLAQSERLMCIGEL